MLIGVIAAAVVVVLTTVALARRRFSHDDVHSVQGYHRSLHTLESINAHAAAPGEDSVLVGKPAFPESALRSTGTHTVRLTDRPTAVPPVPAPAMADPGIPSTFDGASPPEASALSFVVGPRDKAMVSVNHRPRRLAAPATAVAAVLVLIVVLLLTGSHTVAPPARPHAGSNAHAGSNVGTSGPKTHRTPEASTGASTTTTTTQVPVVSLPVAPTARSATYEVTPTNFTLNLAATSGACWVDAINPQTGAVLFVGVLAPGAQHVVAATGPVSVQVGAPTVFRASVDGTAVALPLGFATPFTLSFVPAGP